MMKKSKLLLIAAAAAMVANCKTMGRTANEVGVDNLRFERLKRSEYKIIGNVKGTAETKVILGLIRIGYEKQGSYVMENPEAPTLSGSDKAAIYEALAATPDADAVILPRFERETFAIPFLYRADKVTVNAKAISLLTDKEAPAKAAEPAPAEKAPEPAPAKKKR